MSSGNFSDLDAVKRANLVRLMDEKRIYAAELAKLYGEEGCTPQFISALLKGKSLIGDEVVKALSKARSGSERIHEGGEYLYHLSQRVGALIRERERERINKVTN